MPHASLARRFCDVAAEAFALRLYQGDGAFRRPASTTSNRVPKARHRKRERTLSRGTYQATVLGPQGGPNVTAEWRVDGALANAQSLATGGNASHALAASAGAHILELRVTDNSPIIHPTMRAGTASLRMWTINVAKASTATTIATIVPSPSVIGYPITVTASVAVIAPASGTPSGSVTITDGSANCVITLPANHCTFTPASLAAASNLRTMTPGR